MEVTAAKSQSISWIFLASNYSQHVSFLLQYSQLRFLNKGSLLFDHVIHYMLFFHPVNSWKIYLKNIISVYSYIFFK